MTAQEYADLKENRDAFAGECKEHVDRYKDDLAAAKDGLGLFLDTQPAARLRCGKYVTLKRSESRKKALTADRIRDAISDHINKEYLKSLAADHLHDPEHNIVVHGLEDALVEVNTTVTFTPQIVVSCPKDLPDGKYVIDAPESVEALCEQMMRAQDNIKKTNKHRKDGKAQCEPTMVELQQRVEQVYEAVVPKTKGSEPPPTVVLEPPPLVGDVEEPVQLPALPLGDSVPVPQSAGSKASKKRKAAAPVIKATVQGLERPVKIQKKEYKAKGSAKPAPVTIEDFVDEFGFVIEQEFPTISSFVKHKAKAAKRAVEVFEAMVEQRKNDTPAPAKERRIHISAK